MKNKDLFFVGLSEEISQGVNRREGDSRGLAGWETGSLNWESSLFPAV